MTSGWGMGADSGKINVLFVDDSKVSLSLYKECLNDETYEKKFAHDGKEALSIYNAWKPDLMVLDIVMPEMTGFSVLKQIREVEKKNGRHTAIVMATGMGDKSDILDCAKVGIQGYIVKPFKVDELSAKLEAYYRTYKKTGSPNLS